MDLYVMKVYPKGRGRDVYREINIMGVETLDKLCQVILKSFDFTDEHLYEFCMNNRMYDRDNYQSDPEYRGQPSTKSKIYTLRLTKGQKFSLHYDFGDDWMFVINVQKIIDSKEAVKPFVSKFKGQITQYPDWDDYDYDDED